MERAIELGTKDDTKIEIKMPLVHNEEGGDCKESFRAWVFHLTQDNLELLSE